MPNQRHWWDWKLPKTSVHDSNWERQKSSDQLLAIWNRYVFSWVLKVDNWWQEWRIWGRPFHNLDAHVVICHSFIHLFIHHYFFNFHLGEGGWNLPLTSYFQNPHLNSRRLIVWIQISFFQIWEVLDSVLLPKNISLSHYITIIIIIKTKYKFYSKVELDQNKIWRGCWSLAYNFIVNSII